ncbi:MAG: alpha/beta hydrolase [Actinomycetota bacterium]
MALGREPGGYIDRGSGAPVVMLPGAEGCKEYWHFQVDALSPGYRAVAMDHVVRRPSFSSTMEDYARHVLETMDSLGIEKAVVVGESFGGMVTQQIAIDHPERTLAVALCNTLDRPRGDSIGFNLFTLSTLVAMSMNLPIIPLETRKRILMWAGKHSALVYDGTPGNADLVDYFTGCGLAQGYIAQVDRFFAIKNARFTERLREIRVPTLVMHGSEDRAATGNTAAEIAGRIPRAEIALIEGAGHCHHQTMPQETNAVLLEWLSRVTTGG